MNRSDLRRQVAELFIVRASGFNLDSQRLYPNLEVSNENLKRLLEDGVGGVIFFGGTVNELETRCKVLKKWAGKDATNAVLYGGQHPSGIRVILDQFLIGQIDS